MSDRGQVLTRARDIIADGGWCKGAMHSAGNRHCVLGAVSEAEQQLHLSGTGAAELLDELSPISKQDADLRYMRRAIVFNDDPSTRLADVVMFLDKALAELGESR